MAIGVYDDNDKLEDSTNLNNGYPIQLYLLNTDKTISSASITNNITNTLSGIANFNASINSHGTFFLFANSIVPNIINPVTSLTSFYVETALKSILFSITPSNPTRFFNFTLRIVMLDDNNNQVTDNANLTINVISGGPYIGSTIARTNTGQAILSIYYNTAGDKNISVAYGGLTNSFYFTVYPELLVVNFPDGKLVRFI